MQFNFFKQFTVVGDFGNVINDVLLFGPFLTDVLTYLHKYLPKEVQIFYIPGVLIKGQTHFL